MGDIHARASPRHPGHRAAVDCATLNTKNNERCAVFMSTRTPQELHETYQLLHQTTPAWIAWNRSYQLLQDYKTHQLPQDYKKYRPTTTRLHDTTLNCSLESTWRSFQLIQPGPEQKGCQKETDLWLIYSLFPKWKTSQLYAALVDAAPTNEKTHMQSTLLFW